MGSLSVFKSPTEMKGRVYWIIIIENPFAPLKDGAFLVCDILWQTTIGKASAIMGMYDTVYAELDCPFCGRQYRHSPMSWEDAERGAKRQKEWEIKSRQKFLRGEKAFYLQDFWAKRDGFDDIDVWIAQLDSPDNIEAHRTARALGLAEIQTKQFECLLESFYRGDKVPGYSGHYFIPEEFQCDGCSTTDRHVYVKVWLEIEERKLKAMLTHDPETGKPSREVLERRQPEPRLPGPHPPVHFNYRGLQAHAKYNGETQKYDLEVHHLPERFTFSHSQKELLRVMFESFADDYLYLLGRGTDDRQSLHEHLHSICRRLPSDIQPYGERERDGPDCSSGCRHFLKLPGKLGADWGVCVNPASPRAGLLTFEHQGCENFEGNE